MPFSKEGAKLKIPQSKNCINGTRVTMLFCLERGKLPITHPVKNRVTEGTVLFSWKRGETENTSVKTSVNDKQGTMLFSQEISDQKSLRKK